MTYYRMMKQCQSTDSFSNKIKLQIKEKPLISRGRLSHLYRISRPKKVHKVLLFRLLLDCSCRLFRAKRIDSNLDDKYRTSSSHLLDSVSKYHLGAEKSANS